MAELGVTDTVLAAMLPVLLAASGMISGAETALFSLTHAERVRLDATHPGAARAVRRLFSRPRRMLIGILLINNGVNVVFFVISQALLWRIESGALRAALGLGALLTVIVVGEVLAKLLASAARERYAAVIAPPLAIVMEALGPALSGLDRWIVAPLGRLLRPRSVAPALAAEEMAALLEVSGAEGDLDDAEQSLLSAVLNLGEIRVRDVMRPRVDLCWVEADAAPGQVRTAAAAEGVRWLIVARRTLDDPQRRLLDVEVWLMAGAGAMGPVEPLYVPESARLDQFLDALRRAQSPVALAVDEQGQLSGLIQRDDAIARLLEVSVADGAPGAEVVRLIGLNRWSVAGRLSIREWAEHFSQLAPQVGASGRRVTTIAGLVMGALGRIPAPGDSVRIGPVLFTVESMRGRVVDRVIVDVAPEAAP